MDSAKATRTPNPLLQQFLSAMREAVKPQAVREVDTRPTWWSPILLRAVGVVGASLAWDSSRTERAQQCCVVAAHVVFDRLGQATREHLAEPIIGSGSADGDVLDQAVFRLGSFLKDLTLDHRPLQRRTQVQNPLDLD
jgi:hypothetical protein